MDKMTNVKAIDFVLGNVENLPGDVKEKFKAMRAAFVKKPSSERKPTATQTENVGLKTAILEAMETGKAYTVTDITKLVPALADLSNQRVSALVRQLKEDGLVAREEIKRKAYFTKVEVVGDEDDLGEDEDDFEENEDDLGEDEIDE